MLEISSILEKMKGMIYYFHFVQDRTYLLLGCGYRHWLVLLHYGQLLSTVHLSCQEQGPTRIHNFLGGRKNVTLALQKAILLCSNSHTFGFYATWKAYYAVYYSSWWPSVISDKQGLQYTRGAQCNYMKFTPSDAHKVTFYLLCCIIK